MTSQWWAEPTAGEIVWCHFPDDLQPRPKPRPALILAVFDDDAPQFTVRVAYGTSQRTTTLHLGEFSVLRDRNPAAYEAAGLSYDTKFDLKQAIDPSGRKPQRACAKCIAAVRHAARISARDQGRQKARCGGRIDPEVSGCVTDANPGRRRAQHDVEEIQSPADGADLRMIVGRRVRHV